jgi:CubicO group peptidase (beta-lactamase class C family)
MLAPMAETASTARPTLADWMSAPGNRWAFRHVRELIPTARVRRGPAVLSLPPAAAPELLEIEFADAQGTTRRIDAWLEESYGDALVVLHDGASVLEWLAPGVAADETHVVMSVTKSVTALLAGALAGAGLLDLEGPIVHHVPEAAGSVFGDATVRHLLDMTTGTGFVEDYAPNDDVRAYRQSTGWYPRDGSPHDLHDYLLTIPRGRPHGTRFDYVSPNTDMLGWVLERAAGEPYADALSRYLWALLGAEQDADITVDPAGSPRAAGGLCITPRDMARIGQLVVEDGAGVVPADFVEDLRSGGDPALWAAGQWADFLPGGAYRSCWYQPRTDPGVAIAIGIHGQLIYADPGRRVVVAKQSSWPVAGDDDGDALAIEAARAIAATLV